jgi:hypothetical protein
MVRSILAYVSSQVGKDRYGLRTYDDSPLPSVHRIIRAGWYSQFTALCLDRLLDYIEFEIRSNSRSTTAILFFSDLNKLAKTVPQVLALDPGVVAARWSTLKQTLGWSDEQCREAVVKHSWVALVHYLNQYVCRVISLQRWAE